MNMQAEQWRVIPSLPRVLASSHGRLMKVPHLGVVPGHGATRHYATQATLGQWAEQDNRYVFRYAGKTYKVARLVCEAFHGGVPFPRAVCMHLDEDSRNNRADNLAWGTQRENLNAPKFKAWQRTRTGENNPFIKGRRKRAEQEARGV